MLTRKAALPGPTCVSILVFTAVYLVVYALSHVDLGPSARRQWVMSACQRSLGWSAQKVRHDERRRFCGCEATNPRRDKIRQIVEVAGTADTPAAAR